MCQIELKETNGGIWCSGNRMLGHDENALHSMTASEWGSGARAIASKSEGWG